jgi:hypothetical protein
MRLFVLPQLLIAALLSGCALQGVVVEKRYRPFPFYDSVGMDGIYKFILRDAEGNVCSQMVTPEVFYQYRVGDYFNDLAPARPIRRDMEDFETVQLIPRVTVQPTVKHTQVAHSHHARKHRSKALVRRNRSAKARVRSS